MTTYKEVSEATANDLKTVIEHLQATEKNIRGGDIAALPTMLEKWSLWGQMLLIRLEARTKEYRAGQEAKEAKAAEANPYRHVDDFAERS